MIKFFGTAVVRRTFLRWAAPGVALVMLGSGKAAAQGNSFDVYNEADWVNAFAAAYTYSQSSSDIFTINLFSDIAPSSQVMVNANVFLDGNSHMVNMNGADRAFFIAGGNVTLSDLVIQGGRAAGGTGVEGGGGGAGLGGAIFVGSGTYYGGANTAAAAGISTPNVTLSGVSLQNNQAVGGNSGGSPTGGGGGGGLGGNGGNGSGGEGGGGGGGFGNGATGGSGSTDDDYDGGSGSSGAWVHVNAVAGGSDLSGGGGGQGSDGSNGGSGGSDAGGGGGGGAAGFDYPGTGGGGGLAGGYGHFDNGDAPTDGGAGGFGGGGGGATYSGSGGDGGFGGGGGASAAANGGNGGFGGGGGGDVAGSAGSGGFGAGNGSTSTGGGGLGGGGAIFVMNGASLTVENGGFSGNAVAGGSGSNNGSAIGADLLSGSDVTFQVSSGTTVANVGGAGNLSDPNVANHATNPNAQGGIIKTGAGVLALSGTNTYSGNTTVRQGVLAVAGGASEVGTAVVTVGQSNGDNGTLALGSSANLTLAGFDGTTNGTDQAVVIAQTAGSTGAVVIGEGAGSSGAYVGAQKFTGGSGAASVVFSQEYAAGSTTNTSYEFYTTIEGSASVVQAGNGTTVLKPQYGANSFSGDVVVQSGTLQLGNATAMPTGNNVVLKGGALEMNGYSVNAGTLTLDGGTLVGSQNVAAVNLTPSGQVETVTITTNGYYEFTVAGGQGGMTLDVDNTVGLAGGGGAVVKATMYATAGTQFQAMVGAAGESGTVERSDDDEFTIYAPVAGGGGGGGSFVFEDGGPVPTVLLAAGGGGGAGINIGLAGGSSMGGDGSGGAGGGYKDLSTQGGGGGGGLNLPGSQGTGAVSNDGGEGGGAIWWFGSFNAAGGAGETNDSPHLFGVLNAGDGGYGGGGGGGTGMVGNDTDGGYIDATYGGGGGGGGYTGGAGGSGSIYDSSGDPDPNDPAEGGTSYIATSFSNTSNVAGGNAAASGALNGVDGYINIAYLNPVFTPTNVVAKSGMVVAEIGGTGNFSQEGAGTTTIAAATSFTGETQVSDGILALSAAGALGGTSGIEVTGGTLFLAVSNGINDAASVNLAGGTMEIGLDNLTETIGAWEISASSRLNFSENIAALTFTTLQVNAALAIWYWDAGADSITITSGVLGNLNQIVFYSDAGNTVVGYGAMQDDNLVAAVPEPGVGWLILCGGAALMGWRAWRDQQKARRYAL